MNKYIKLFNLVVKKDLLKALLSQAYSGYLYDSGWIESFKEQAPISLSGEPLPWITLPCLDFLKERLSQDVDVLEYGSGNSTLYFSKNVRSVSSIEHDKEWFDKVNKNAPDNVSMFYCSLQYDGAYCRSAKEFNKKFNLIMIDGRDRVNCIKNCLDILAQSGCIILDDSERKQYENGVTFLENNSFKRLDFWGVALGLTYKKCTTIFYRENNFFGI